MMKSESGEEKNLITNRKAHHDYFIIETYEVGIALIGTEVKSLRFGNANLLDSYAIIKNGEIWLMNMHVSPYEQATIYNHEPKRERRLLLHKKEIRRIYGKMQEKGITLVPLRVYLIDNKIKVELGLVRGKKSYDKREDIKEREVEREVRRKYNK
jgi:SsrA-binding protein